LNDKAAARGAQELAGGTCVRSKTHQHQPAVGCRPNRSQRELEDVAAQVCDARRDAAGREPAATAVRQAARAASAVASRAPNRPASNTPEQLGGLGELHQGDRQLRGQAPTAERRLGWTACRCSSLVPQAARQPCQRSRSRQGGSSRSRHRADDLTPDPAAARLRWLPGGPALELRRPRRRSGADSGPGWPESSSSRCVWAVARASARDVACDRSRSMGELRRGSGLSRSSRARVHGDRAATAMAQ